MKTLLLSIFFLTTTIALSLSGQVVNPDKPSKGEWDFKLKQVWEVEQAGDDIFAQLTGLLVAENPKDPKNAHLYIRDSKNHKTHIFTTDGQYLSAFAPRGEGPGEVRNHMSVYLAGNALVISDFDKLHFFKQDGTFIKSVSNIFFRRRPVFFIDQEEFIAAPINVFQGPDRKGIIRRVNLQTGKDKVISEFQVFEGGDIRSSTRERRPARLIVIVGLSPLMTAAPGKDNKLYYGVSNEYKIYVSNLEGKALSWFSVERKNKRISPKQKKQLFAGIRNLEEDERKRLMDNFPDEPTYFYRIEEVEGLIYVSVPDPLSRFPGHQNPKQIDIFSLEGKYLYRSHMKFDGNRKPLSLLFRKGLLYAVLEDEDGSITLAKYHISQP